MKLARMRLENFRCYREPFEIEFESLTGIIGRNDVGKSAVMDALAIFFDPSNIDRSDASVGPQVNNVSITCVFSELPLELIIDADHPTSLAEEYLLNADGELEVVRTFDCGLVNPKIRKTEARCLHPTAEGFADLLLLKRAELTARAGELGIDLTDVNKAANAPIRKAIWNGCDDLQLEATLVSLETEGGKSLWTALSSFLPAFALFKSDRASTDQDEEAQDPLKAAIKTALKEVEEKLEEIRTFVEAEVKTIADATLLKLREMDASVADSLNAVVSTKKWDSLFTTSITDDDGIPLNKRGSGIKRLVLLNFFRAEAEKQAQEKSKGSVIYAIEEPETSQHPRNQRMLMSALSDLAAQDGRQVIVTTHTPMLARIIPEDSLRFIEKDGQGNRSLTVGGGEANSKIAKSLGILPDHTVRLFVGVEGPYDIAFLKAVSRIWKSVDNNIPDLEALEFAGELIFIPLGGSNLAVWSSRLKNLNRPEVHITDRDVAPPAPAKYQEHCDAINARDGCSAHVTVKREMENYLHHDAIMEHYAANGVQIALGPFQDFDDVPHLVAESVYAAAGNDWNALDEIGKAEKARRAKRQLNGSVLNYMTSNRLAESDPNAETRVWLESITNTLNAMGHVA